MNVLFCIIDSGILLALVWIMLKTFQSSPIQKAFFPALFLKLAAGIFLGIIYKTYYEGGDTFSFFKASVTITNWAKTDLRSFIGFLISDGGMKTVPYAGQPRALFMIKILSVVNLITNSNYWLTSLFLSFFSFAGLWTLADRLSRIYKRSMIPILLSLLFFPSVVFWSSGIIKESVALGAMGFLLAVFLGYVFRQRQFKLTELPLLLIMGYLLWNTKYYYAGILMIMMVATAGTLFFKNQLPRVASSTTYQLMIFIALCVLFLLAVTSLHPNFYLSRIPEVLVANYNAFRAISDKSDLIHYHHLLPSWGSILKNAPKALISGMFRPFPGEGRELFKIVAEVENLLLLALTISAFWRKKNKMSTENRLLLISALFYCMVLSIFLALSAPNFGTLVRYKVGFLPILLLLVTFNNPLIERLNKLIK